VAARRTNARDRISVATRSAINATAASKERVERDTSCYLVKGKRGARLVGDRRFADGP